MVILFRPYLLDQKPEKSHCNNQDLETTSINTGASLICRWIDCGRSFESLDSLSNHVAKEHANPGKGGMFYCGWSDCNRGDKGFNARYKMLVHVRTHTNEKPHHCYQCNKSFSRAENLKIHSRSHTGEKPYVCTVPGCGKAYSNSSDRFKHSRTHAVDKPYACKIPGCPKKYTDPSSLRKHVKTYKHYSVTAIADESKEKQLEDKKPTPMINDRINLIIPSPSVDPYNLVEKKLFDSATLKLSSVMSYLPYNVNDIYLWQPSVSEFQFYDSPSIRVGLQKYSEIDEPLDLSMHCD